MSTPWWHTLSANFVIGEENSVVNDLSKGLIGKEFNLLQLVEQLGSYLTSSEKHIRSRGIQLLSEILHRIPQDYLSNEEIAVLITFYTNRLKDHHSLTPHVLFGLVALSAIQDISDEGALLLLQNVFKEVHVQSLSHGARRHVYYIMSNFLTTKIEVLQKWGEDFVFGFIQAMDGEKDPRNLIICFKCVHIIAANFPIDICTEDLFEVVACYFPIDFTPPKNDRFSVRKEDLVLSLRAAMSATPLFAGYCLPLLMEKLSSARLSAKVDALQTLASCSERYGFQAIKDYTGSFLFSIKRELFTSNEEIEESALLAVTAMARTLSTEPDENGSHPVLEEYISDIYNECHHHLCEPEMKLMSPSAKLLQAAALASNPASCLVINKVLPLMLKQFDEHPQANKRITIVDTILNFLKVPLSGTLSSQAHNPVEMMKNSLYQLFVTLLGNANCQLRCLGMQGLLLLMQFPGLLSKEETKQISLHFINILQEDQDKHVILESIESMGKISSFHPDIIIETVVDRLLSHIKTETMEVDGCKERCVPKDTALLALSDICIHQDIVQSVVPELVKYLQTLHQKSDTEEFLEETKGTCRSLHKIVLCNSRNNKSIDYFHNYLIPQLFALAILGTVNNNDHNSVLVSPDITESLAATIRVIVQNVDDSSKLLSTTVQFYLEGSSSPSNDSPIASEFHPLEVTSPWQQTQLISLLTAVVCASKQNDIPNCEMLLKCLENMALQSDHGPTKMAACKCLAGADVESFITKFLTKINSILEAEEKNKSEAFLLFIWVAKAIILRGHHTQYIFTKKIIWALTVDKLASIAADGFRIILEEYEDIMSTEMHANIKIMYRQHVFVQTLTSLIKGFHSCSQVLYALLMLFIPDMKQHYLVALSHLLRFIPKQVLLPELPALLPLLVQSLTCPTASLQLATMATIADLLEHDPQLLSSHIDDTVPHLLQLAHHKPSMKMRIAALKCIGLLTRLPVPVVVRHKPTIVRSLVTCLDDHKRLVRAEAVTARNEWFLLDTRN